MLKKLSWWLFGGCRSYDPPRPNPNGSFILAEYSFPIWKRFYIRHFWKFKPALGETAADCEEATQPAQKARG